LPNSSTNNLQSAIYNLQSSVPGCSPPSTTAIRPAWAIS
jgi:hypothetical protein